MILGVDLEFFGRRFGIENASFFNDVMYLFSSIETKFSEFFHLIFALKRK